MNEIIYSCSFISISNSDIFVAKALCCCLNSWKPDIICSFVLLMEFAILINRKRELHFTKRRSELKNIKNCYWRNIVSTYQKKYIIAISCLTYQISKAMNYLILEKKSISFYQFAFFSLCLNMAENVEFLRCRENNFLLKAFGCR